MIRKILLKACIPFLAMPFIYQQVAPAVAAIDKQQQFLYSNTSSNSLLISSTYNKDRDDDRECRRKYREVYRNIERDRERLRNANDERDYRRYRRNLDRNLERLEDLRDRYSNCNYYNADYDREYDPDYDRGYDPEYDRDYDEYYNRDYRRDYPPVVVPLIKD